MWTPWRQNKSSSSVAVDFLSLCDDIVLDIQELAERGTLLNERQCLDLSCKLLDTLRIIRIVTTDHAGSNLRIERALQSLYRYVEKAKLLVEQCGEGDWCEASVFQGQNENSFKEILQDVSFCYNAIVDQVSDNRVLRLWPSNRARRVALLKELVYLRRRLWPSGLVREVEEDEELRKEIVSLLQRLWRSDSVREVEEDEELRKEIVSLLLRLWRSDSVRKDEELRKLFVLMLLRQSPPDLRAMAREVEEDHELRKPIKSLLLRLWRSDSVRKDEELRKQVGSLLLRLWCFDKVMEVEEDEELRKELVFLLLRQSPSNCPATAREVEEDEQELRKKLEGLANEPSSVKLFSYFLRERTARKQSLARYLLRRFRCTSQESQANSFDRGNAILWEKETEASGTWGNSKFLGAGSGASGVCSTQWLGIPCAKKEFHAAASEASFLKEAGILAHLKHPCIVTFMCCGNGEEKGDRFLAMELMEESLFDVIEGRKGAYFSVPVVVDIILQIARGMHYLHGEGVAHRDLKPQNVVVKRLRYAHLVDDYYCVKLVDFGMSKTKVEVSKSNTISVRGVGTTRYRAPEVHPKAHPDGLGKARWLKADVYSFAMTCAHLLFLKTPFEDMEQLSELYEELLSGRRPEICGEYPEELVALLKECWDTDPQARPSFLDICIRLEVLRNMIVLGWSWQMSSSLVGFKSWMRRWYSASEALPRTA